MAMPIVFMDGFDWYAHSNSDVMYEAGAFQGTIAASSTRHGVGQGMQVGGSSVTKTLPSTYAYFIWSYAISPTLGQSYARLRDQAGLQRWYLHTDDAGRFLVGTAALGTVWQKTAPGVMHEAKWHHVAVAMRIDDDDGECHIWVDGHAQNELPTTGIDTDSSAGGASGKTFGSFIHRTAPFGAWIDDHYILGGTPVGLLEDEFPGDRIIYTDRPGADGDQSDWTPKDAANNYLEVNSNPVPEADEDYNESSTVGHVDLFDSPTLPSEVTAVEAVQLTHVAKQETGTVFSDSSRNALKQGGTTYFGALSHVLAGTYLGYPDIFEEDPDTAAAWTVSGVESLQPGYEKET